MSNILDCLMRYLTSIDDLTIEDVPKKIEDVTKKTEIESVYELPSFCFEIAKRLDQQRIIKETFPGEWGPMFGSPDEGVKREFKTIILESCQLAAICDLFSRNASRLSNSNYWNMVLKSDALTERSLVRVYRKEIERDSEESLERNFIKIFKKFTSNWVQANSDDHPDIYYKKDKSEFLLFIKRSEELACFQESTLVQSIFDQLSIGKKIFEIDALYENNKYYCGNTYMWIKKDKIEEVVEKMGFRCLTKKFLAADIFATIVLYADDYLRKKDDIKEDNPFYRFFKITKSIPMEIQKIVANRASGIASPDNHISAKYFNIALKQILYEIHTPS